MTEPPGRDAADGPGRCGSALRRGVRISAIPTCSSVRPDARHALGDLHGHHDRDRIPRPDDRADGQRAGNRRPVTLRDSSWLVSLSIFHHPEVIGQPPGASVWWGFGCIPAAPAISSETQG